MGGQAVHEDGVRRRQFHEMFRHLIRREDDFALGGFVLLTHAGPDVGVNGPDALHRLRRVCHHVDVAARLPSSAPRLAHHGRARTVAGRRGHPQMHAQARRRQHQGVAHVVAIAHVSHLEAAQLAEELFEREEVRQRLAGMEPVREGVDHGNADVLGQLFEHGWSKVRATIPCTQHSRLRATSLISSRSPSRDCS